jgi:hypothetical protein
MKQQRMVAKALILSTSLLMAAGQAQGAGYESNKKMGIPEDVDAIHSTYLPVMIDKDFQSMMKMDKEYG